MKLYQQYIAPLFFNNKIFLLLAALSILFFASLFSHTLFVTTEVLTGITTVAVVINYVLLFFFGGLTGKRVVPMRLSLGDDNAISLTLTNNYPFPISVEWIDELPFQLQNRNQTGGITIPANGTTDVIYYLNPTSRGEYAFGTLWGYVALPFGFIQRRLCIAPACTAKVYPSLKALRQQKLEINLPNNSSNPGHHKTRRSGNSLEFDKIKEYVIGDDVRLINWKATARTNALMVNTFTDARQQQVYCLIDKGRNMKLPFDGMTLLDHAINAAVAVLHTSLQRQDKAGLVTYSNTVNDWLQAERKNNQMHKIMELLYAQETNFSESDYEAVWKTVRTRINQRSLVMVFTNFETMSGLERQLPFLKQMAKHHLTCVLFFQNTLLEQIHQTQLNTIEGIYTKTIADQFAAEKRQIVKQLRKHGIITILSSPRSLGVDAINKYLEIKAMQQT